MSSPKRPGRCLFCFRVIGLTINGKVCFHKYDGKKCGGIGKPAGKV